MGGLRVYRVINRKCEVGAVVTDGLFDEIDSYEAVITHNLSAVAIRMAQDDWWPSRPQYRSKCLPRSHSQQERLQQLTQSL